MLRVIDLTTGYGPVEVLHEVNLDFEDANIVTAVSYTHLDVYKRQ